MNQEIRSRHQIRNVFPVAEEQDAARQPKPLRPRRQFGGGASACFEEPDDEQLRVREFAERAEGAIEPLVMGLHPDGDPYPVQGREAELPAQPIAYAVAAT